MTATLYEFFKQNIVLVYFAYGLAFFIMGVALALQYRRFSSFRLTGELWQLAGFGLLHGLYEWGYVFIPIQADYLGRNTVLSLVSLDVVLAAASFAFLFQFGLELVTRGLGPWRVLRILPFGLFCLWVVYFLALRVRFTGVDPEIWVNAGEIWARYLLALPGSVTAAWGLYLQCDEFRDVDLPRICFNVLGLAGAFTAYGVVAGAIVPPGAFFPASVVNTQTFFATTGLPVQIFRALCAVMMAYFTIRLLEMFDFEVDRRLEEMERREAIAGERLRIARDLHDGIIQQIYAAGLHLENALFSLDGNPGAAEQVRDTMGRLNRAIQDIRRYILDLKPVNLEEKDLDAGLEALLQELKATALVQGELIWHGRRQVDLPVERLKNLYLIVREALANAARHSRASVVEVEVTCQDGAVRVTIRDNGKGFDPGTMPGAGQGHGLSNMAQRAAALGGELSINSARGQGTEITVIIPLEGETSGASENSACR